jgi:surface antigen
VTTNTAVLETIVQAGACGPADLNSYPPELCGQPISSVQDSLGYYNRQCGSYAAWQVVQAGQQMPPHSVMGDAGYWPQNVDPGWIVTTPQPGDIAVVPVNLPTMLGHAMYVSWVNPDTTLVTKSYNWGVPGDFSMQHWATSGVKSGTSGGVPYSTPFSLVFIRFPAA